MTATTTTTLQKRSKKKVQSVEEIFKWAEQELQKATELFSKRKSEVILETARRLEDSGIEKSKIANEITKNLKGFVDDGYALRVLKDYPQYKQQYRVENAKKAKSSSLKRAKHEENKDSSTQEPQNVEQEDAPTGFYQMKVEDFKIKDVDLYDRIYLVELVRYLFEKLPQDEQEKH